MSPDNPTKIPIVFVHGLWLHAESWNPWIEFFHENGYDAIAASWLGDAATTEPTRRNADAVAGYGVTEIADHIAQQIRLYQRRFRAGSEGTVSQVCDASPWTTVI